MTNTPPRCRQPDHDNAKLVCGYPLPCPWHTVVIDTNVTPPTLTIPITSDAARNMIARERLASIGIAFASEKRRRKKKQ
jgi:hypothetical protein